MKERSRSILALALGLLGLGVLSFVLSLVLEARPALLQAAGVMRWLAPYFVLAGFALLVVYVVVRPKPAVREETNLFGNDSTNFAPQDERDPPRER